MSALVGVFPYLGWLSYFPVILVMLLTHSVSKHYDFHHVIYIFICQYTIDSKSYFRKSTDLKFQTSLSYLSSRPLSVPVQKLDAEVFRIIANKSFS